MVKSTRPVRASAEDRVSQLLADSEAAGHEEAVAQVDFWTRLRPFLAANEASSGLEALDNLALSVLAGYDSTPLALADTVLVLPPPDRMYAGQATPHDVFHEDDEPEPPKRPAARARGKARRQPPTKKQKLSKRKAKTPSPSFELELPEETPDRIKRDVARILRAAAAQGLPPFRLSYPWAGQRAWYDPKKYRSLARKHYRFWMKHREVFFMCALYPPSNDSEYRRKQKANAILARLRFIGVNILTFGYFGFLERFEQQPHDTLMWQGGLPSKHSAKAKLLPSGAKTAEDLASLYKTDLSRYQRTVDRVLDPLQVDEDGYSSIRKLLEQSGALDMKQKANLRLTDEVLARIAYDATEKKPARASWIGNTSNGVWKQLVANKELRAIQDDRHREWDAEVGPSDDEKDPSPTTKGEDDSDFEDEVGDPTVLPPSKPFRHPVKSVLAEARHTGLSEADDDGEEEPTPPKKKAPKPIAPEPEYEEEEPEASDHDDQDEDDEQSDSDATDDKAEQANGKKSSPPKSKSTTPTTGSKTPSPNKSK